MDALSLQDRTPYFSQETASVIGMNMMKERTVQLRNQLTALAVSKPHAEPIGQRRNPDCAVRKQKYGQGQFQMFNDSFFLKRKRGFRSHT